MKNLVPVCQSATAFLSALIVLSSPSSATPVELIPIAGVKRPVGIAFRNTFPFPDLMISVNEGTGIPYNFAKFAADGSIGQVTSQSGIVNEIKLASARLTQAGFVAGEVFFGSDQPRVIGRILPNGTVILPWVTLQLQPGHDNEIVRSLFVNQRAGTIFQDRLIATTTEGRIVAITGGGQVTEVHRVPGQGAEVDFEACVVVPNDPKYGDLIKDHILVGVESGDGIVSTKGIWAVTTGSATEVLHVEAEDLDFIVAADNFFVANVNNDNTALNRIDYIPANTLSAFDGEILVTSEHVLPHFRVLRWNNPPQNPPGYTLTDLNLTVGGEPAQGNYEHGTFAPLDFSPPTTQVVSVEAYVTPVNEDGSSGPGQFTFFRSGPLNDPLSMVNFELPQTGPGRATLGGDYALSPDIVFPFSFAFSEFQGISDLDIVPLKDNRSEGNETVLLNLLPGAGYSVSSLGSATVTIIDAPPPPVPPNLTFTITSVMPIGSGSEAWALNSTAQVVGKYWQNQQGGSVVYTGYRWQQGVGYQTLVPGGGYAAFAYGINDNEVVAGGINAGSSAFPNAFSWVPNVFTTLNGIGGSQTIALDINIYQLSVGHGWGPIGSSYSRALCWNGTALVNMGTLAGPTALRHAYAYGINNPFSGNALVVGRSGIAGSGDIHAFRAPFGVSLDPSHDLGTMAGSGSSEANDINDLNEVAGASTVPGGEVHAVYRAPGGGMNEGFVDLGALPGGNRSFALAINNTGHIVGRSYTTSSGAQRAAIWFNDGTKKNLSDVGTVPNLGSWVLTSAEDINDSGVIVGNGVLNGVTRGYILVPNMSY